MTGTGEEWRDMDAQSRVYRPQAYDTQLTAAKAAIEQHRKAAARLRFVHADGTPLMRQPIAIEQVRSVFPVGDNLWPLAEFMRFGEDGYDRCAAWCQRFTEALDAANALCYWTERPRNDGPKTEDRQGEPKLDDFARCVDWARAAGLHVKGHPLFWSIPKCVPEWIKRYDIETRWRFAEVRVRNLVARFRGRVTLWDAVNEALWEPAFANLDRRNWPHLDPIPELADMIGRVLGWCRAEDPDATFIINDYGLELDPPKGAPLHADGTPVTAARQRQRMLALIAALRERGTPPDAIGLQSHTGGWMGHDAQMAMYDELSAGGLPIHITEFWADLHHLEGVMPKPEALALQADYMRNYLTCAFAHPQVDAFFFWGFMASAITWHGTRSSHDLNPVFGAIRDLVHGDWRTRLEAVTDHDGRLQFRGFLGEYRLRHPSPLGPKGVAYHLEAGQDGERTIVVR